MVSRLLRADPAPVDRGAGRLVTWVLCALVSICAAGGTASADFPKPAEGAAQGTRAVALARGPYLQLGTDTGITIRWRTDTPSDSRVIYGLAPGSLGSSVQVPGSVTEHVVALTGLDPETKYYYAVGTSTLILAGDDTEHSFVTAPSPGTARPLRIWIVGDSGFDNDDQRAVRDAYYAYTSATHTDLWLHVGDVSQVTGTDLQYQSQFFDIYPEMLRKSVLWPTIGNHDAANADPLTQTGPYFEIFTLPTSGEAGGLASGTEAYYSFDWANVHFVVLDSQSLDPTHVATMLTWLQSDLLATTRHWVIAYWHHPPYSKAKHDSDDPADSEGRLVAMREQVVPILEDHGVDLAFSGHSHSYERSYLIDGHYGDSSEFAACDDAGTPSDPADDFCVNDPGTLCPGGMIDCDVGSFLIDAGDGRVAGDGPYFKPVFGLSPHDGTVYTVAGSSGQAWGGSLDHPAMVVSLNVLGSVVLGLDTDRLDATFLDSTGAVRDGFTLLKGCFDHDSDGYCADADNCPFDANGDQNDADSDGRGDACDLCPADATNDVDSDGVCGQTDNCPAVPNPTQDDADSDDLGDSCDPCPVNADLGCQGCPEPLITDPDGDGACDTELVLVQAGVPDDTVLLELGSGMRWLANESDPAIGLDWVLESFDDQSWSTGTYGVGFETAGVDGADALIQTAAPTGSRSVFTRAEFEIVNLGEVNHLFLGVDYDDGYVAWINGVEVYRSPEMPDTGPTWDGVPLSHESSNGTTPDYRPLRDISTSGIPALHTGTNVLAIGVWTVSPSSDLVLVPRLSYTTAAPVRYLANSGDPGFGLTWVERGFNDSGWPGGAYGLGYERGSGVEDLVTTEVPIGSYSVYSRTWFDIPDASKINKMFIGADYDDGYAAWINGVEVYRSPQIGPGDPAWNTNAVSHESSNARYPAYGTLIDISGVGVPWLLDGANLLAVGVWNNNAPSSSDLVLVPRLSVNGSVDNCPAEPNPDQADVDSDGLGDSCDPCPLDATNFDSDSDGACDGTDNCPLLPNPLQEDGESDGVGDPCDNCPAHANLTQTDADSDGAGDACDSCPLDPLDDEDSDGVCGSEDNCPSLYNPPPQFDDDSDGAGNDCDCLPADGSVFGAPHDIRNLRMPAGGTTIEWDSDAPNSGSSTIYDVMRGSIDEFPVGAGGAEICLEPQSTDTSSEDTDPVTGAGYYYLVRGVNACGVGRYGTDSSGANRTTTICP